MSLEAIENEARIDSYLRQWAASRFPIQLPEPAAERKRVFTEAFGLGLKVLLAPRVALDPFIDVPAASWASDVNFPMSERFDRFNLFIRGQASTGIDRLRELGAELIDTHNLQIPQHSGGPQFGNPGESMWLQGLLAELETPKKFASKKKFLNEYRDRSAEMFDIDLQASHYAYGLDYLCTLDEGKKAGAHSIMHPDRRKLNAEKFEIRVISPLELLEKVHQA